MSEEIWKVLPEFPDYDVSNHGRIRRRYKHAMTRVMKAVPNRHGYIRVQLRNLSGAKATHFLHRLVASAFLGPLPQGLQVGHVDGSRCNNRIENLVYVTPKQNAYHKYRHGTWPSGENNGHCKTTERKALYYKFCYMMLGESASSIATRVDSSETEIYGIVSKWRHLDPIINAAIQCREMMAVYEKPAQPENFRRYQDI